MSVGRIWNLYVWYMFNHLRSIKRYYKWPTNNIRHNIRPYTLHHPLRTPVVGTCCVYSYKLFFLLICLSSMALPFRDRGSSVSKGDALISPYSSLCFTPLRPKFNPRTGQRPYVWKVSSVLSRRSVVSSGYSGFLHQKTDFIIIISPPSYDPGCCWDVKPQ